MIGRLISRLYIWALNRGWIKVHPWQDPRRPAHDRAQWIKARLTVTEFPWKGGGGY